MTISLRISKEEGELFKQYADMNNISVSEMIRKAVMEKIEDEFDLQCCERAIEEYRNNPVTYSHEDVAALLDLD